MGLFPSFLICLMLPAASLWLFSILLGAERWGTVKTKGRISPKRIPNTLSESIQKVFFRLFVLEAVCMSLFFLFHSASCLLNKSSQVGLTTHD